MSIAANLDHDHGADAADKNCPNCEAVLGGHFCANCGQEAYLHHASTREFLHEFIGHYVALEGKLWGTVTRLLFRPGMLTNEYIRGRRVRFVQPLRLYLTLSLLFFALMKFTSGFDPAVEDDDGKAEVATTQAAVDTAGKIAKAQAKVAGKLQAAVPQDPQSAQGAAAAEAAIADMEKDNSAQAAVAAKAIKLAEATRVVKAAETVDAPAPAAEEKHETKQEAKPEATPEAKHGAGDKEGVAEWELGDWLKDWPRLQHQWQVFEALPREEQKKVFKDGFYHYAPYAIFCLMPVFALFLKVLYLGSGRRFGEHLLFALHTNAFAYFMFTAMLLIPTKPAGLVLWCWLLGYLPWAMRRVYHRSRFGTFCRWMLLMFFYLLSVGLAILFSMGMGVMTVGH